MARNDSLKPAPVFLLLLVQKYLSRICFHTLGRSRVPFRPSRSRLTPFHSSTTRRGSYVAAGELAETGFGAVDRAAELAKAVAVAQSLFDLQGRLGDRLKDSNAKSGTVDTLGAMLTLSKAKNEYGFDAAQYGLTAEEASVLAATFAKYDTAGTGRLNSGDVYDLARALGITLSVEDSAAALKILDADGNGSIEFGEFVQWYLGTVALNCSLEGCEPELEKA